MNEKNTEASVENTHKWAVGMDVGGTNTVMGVVSQSGDIVAEASIRTRDYPTAEAFADAAAVCVTRLIRQVGGTNVVAGLGIGAPNGNRFSGSIEQAPNIVWAHERRVPLADMMSARLDGMDVRLTNDANAAAMGEMAYGAARGMSDFIVITLGTGVGAGIVTGGQLLYGHDGFAGELGHITMVRGEGGRACGCGRKGCLETYCSATGVARTAVEMLETDTVRPSVLRTVDVRKIDARLVGEAAAAGDGLAIEVLERTGRMLGEACADFMAFSSPQAFIFFGGLCRAGEALMRPLREAYDRHVMPVYRGKAQFLVSELMDRNAAVLGAAALTIKLSRSAFAASRRKN